MIRKACLLLLTLTLCLSTFGSAHAQTADEVFCGDLKEEDCAILKNAQEAAKAAAQYGFDASIVPTLAGIRGMKEDVVVPVGVKALIGTDPKLKAAFELLNPMDQDEMTATMIGSPQLFLDVVEGFDLDLTVTTDMSFDVARTLGWLRAPMLEGRQFYTTEVRLVDGTFYLDQTYMTPFGDFPRGWLEFPISEWISQAIADGFFEAAARQLELEAAGGAPMRRPTSSEAIQAIFGDEELLHKFTTIRRGEDVDGAATFVTEVDWIALVASPEFADAVVEQAQAGAFEEFGMTDAEVEQNVKLLGFMAPMLLQGLEVSATETIDLATYYEVEDTLNVEWDLTSLMQLAAMSDPSLPAPDPAKEEPRFNLAVDIQYRDWAAEQVDAVAVPEDAVQVPLDYLLGEQ